MARASSSFRHELDCQLQQLCPSNGRVKQEVAEEMIKQSAWWIKPGGRVRAPRHAERLQGDERSWSLVFGANTFNVATAVKRCCDAIRGWLDQQSKPISQNSIPPRSWVVLTDSLASAIRSSVTGSSGGEFRSYQSGNEMVFGTQAVNIVDFIKTIARLLDLDQLVIYGADALAGCQPNRSPKQSTRDAAVSETLKTARVSSPGRVTKPAMTECPKCGCKLRADRLERHRCNPQAIKNACPKCGSKVRVDRLEKHLAERCPNISMEQKTLKTLAKEGPAKPAAIAKPKDRKSLVSRTNKIESTPAAEACPACTHPRSLLALRGHIPSCSRNKT